MEDIFNCLCSALAEPEVKQLFLEAEGVELMVIMMKSAKPFISFLSIVRADSS